MEISDDIDRFFLEVYENNIDANNTNTNFDDYITEEEIQKINCTHKIIYIIDDKIICKDCGFEKNRIVFEPEWNHFCKIDHNNYNGKITNPQNFQDIKKNLDKRNVVLDKRFQDEILLRLRQVKILTNTTDTVRGKCRLGILGSCMFIQYAENNIARPITDIFKTLSILKKHITKGYNLFLLSFKNYRTFYVEPEKFLNRIHFKLDIDNLKQHHIDQIYKLIVELKNRSSLFKNKSIPYSVCAGITYCYITEMNKRGCDFKINKHEYSKKVDLSEITIVRISNEALKILNQ